MLASLFISGHNWLLPAAGIFLFSVALVVWNYFHAPANPAIRAICGFLKFLGIAALVGCLLEPLWSGQRARPGANYFAVVADNSQGMQIKDRGAAKNRGEMLHSLLLDDKMTWQAKLDEQFQIRRYLFDSRLQQTRDFGDQNFQGKASAIGVTLRTLAERYKGQPLAGVLLLTDGNATDLKSAADLPDLPPVYPVLFGKDQPERDIAILNTSSSQSMFEDAPVAIQADVQATGYSGENIVAQLWTVGQPGSIGTNGVLTNAVAEKLVTEQTKKISKDTESVAFRFQVKPERSGLLFYRLRVSGKGELDQFTKPETTREATLANNSSILTVNRSRGPYRVLYVAGRPNWEFKFLNRAVMEDDQIQMVGLIRIAKREPKFDFRGRSGESSNPLFRGFGNQSKEEIERYDKPVLIRLNTEDALELKGGFPKGAEELYQYHAIIVDDVEAEFFTPDQMTLLHKFVSERGGGFLMLGGMESFHEGKYQGTPIADMLPVYLDHIEETGPLENLKFSLSREGLLESWARLRNNESEEKDRLGNMPGFQVLNHVRGTKPGSSVIASVSDGKNQHPALIVQRFGNGRTAALTVGDFWRWGLKEESTQRDLGRAWRQMVRWLVSDVPNRVEIAAEQNPSSADGTVTLQVRVRDKKFQALDNAAVAVSVRHVGQEAAPKAPANPKVAADIAATNDIHLTAEAVLNEAGLYETTFVPREAGGYKAEVIVTDPGGATVGHAAAGWSSDPAADEFRTLSPNRALLEEIAKKTGGEMVAADKLDAFAAQLPYKHVPITEDWTTPFWHQPLVFLFALACFAAEWGLRRWKGLL
jgi:uncharacterized membrane protein